MQNMQLMNDQMHQNFVPSQQGQGRGRGRGRGRDKRDQGCVRQGNRTVNEGYYHTHGNCAHSSAYCNTPGPNHNNAATFTDMMGGSTNRCYWINQ